MYCYISPYYICKYFAETVREKTEREKIYCCYRVQEGHLMHHGHERVKPGQRIQRRRGLPYQTM